MKRLIKFFVRKIPRKFLIKYSFMFSRLVIPFYKGSNFYCPICESNFRKFLPFGNRGEDNRLCPKCLSLERHRLMWLFLKNRTHFFSEHYKVLHIAPEQPFFKRFKALKNLDYTTADLESPIADILLDIRNMPLDNDTYNVVICNHVLEHIDDEAKAMSEIFRVMKKGGWAILQVPIDMDRETTYEDASITDPKEREKHFGQYDHMRFHGRDYPQRLEKSGFKVIPDDFIRELSIPEQEKMRLPKNEIIYLCFKE